MFAITGFERFSYLTIGGKMFDIAWNSALKVIQIAP